MKRKISLTTLAMIFFAMLCVSLAPAARAQACSLALTAGKWGFTTNGTVVGIGTRVSVGILTFDAAGNVAAFVFDDNVRKFRAIFTSAVLPNGTPLAIVITADGRKLFPESSFQQ